MQTTSRATFEFGKLVNLWVDNFSTRDATHPTPNLGGKTAFAAHAPRLLDAGYSPIPIVTGEKRPVDDEWQTLCVEPLTQQAIAALSRRAWCSGVGVACGYNGLLAIDFDSEDPDFLDALASLLPSSPVGKRGGKGLTAFYRAPAGVHIRSRRLLGKDKRTIVEMLSHRTQTVIPPSHHPETGGKYRWLTRDTLLTVRPCDLPEVPADIVAQIERAAEPWRYRNERAISAASNFVPRSDAATLGEVELRRYRGSALKALEIKVQELALVKTGGRNHALYAMICGIGRYGHHAVLPWTGIISAARAACTANGWLDEVGEAAFRDVIRNGFNKTKGEPLGKLRERPRYRRAA